MNRAAQDWYAKLTKHEREQVRAWLRVNRPPRWYKAGQVQWAFEQMDRAEAVWF